MNSLAPWKAEGFLFGADLLSDSEPKNARFIVTCLRLLPTLKALRCIFCDTSAFLLLFAQVVLAQQPTPILPDPKLTAGDTFDVTAEDLCVLGYAKKVRNVPAEMKREVDREYGI
jgi:hypothetical protein